jgi:hypothetical protein
VDVLPAQADKGLYSVYFSKGVVLEAETIAAEIAREGKAARVVQYLTPDGPGRAGAAALRLALLARGNFEIRDVVAGPDGWPAATAARDRQFAVFWLPADSIPAVIGRKKEERWSRVFVSSTLLRAEPDARPHLDGIPVDLVHPFTPPAELDKRFVKDLAWLGARGVPPGERRIQDQTLAACMVTGDALAHVVKKYDRDFFLEFVDHNRDQALSAFHSRLSFGPGQRILQRGCYLVRDGGSPPRWVIP